MTTHQTTPGDGPAEVATAAPDSPRTDPRRLVGAVLGLTAAICLMVLAFAAPAINSGADDLPLAVSGPDAAVAQLTATLDEQQPGAFEVTTYADADAVTGAIEDREAIGGISVAPDGVTVQTASAAGAPYAPLLRNLAAGMAAGGQDVQVVDVVPLTADDPTGAGLSLLALPLVFGGMASAVVLTLLAKHSNVVRGAAALAFSLLAGFAATAILQFWLGSVDGSYWLTSVSVSLGIAAISLVVLGLESLVGYAGFGIGALTMLFVANPLSGMASGAAWLPQPWGAIGQLLPVGAASTAIRSAAFFDGAGAGAAYVVLGCWILVGLALLAFASARKGPRPAGA